MNRPLFYLLNQCDLYFPFIVLSGGRGHNLTANILVNCYWHNTIYQKNIELEERERALREEERLIETLKVHGWFGIMLENIKTYIEENQEEIEELMHDMEVSK